MRVTLRNMNDTTDKQSAIISLKRRSRLAEFFIRLVREKPLGTACGIVILILILVAIFADLLMPFPYDELHLRDRLQGPSAQYLLGTDQLGQDVLSRLIYGARISFLVAVAVTAIMTVLSTLIGGISGFLGSRFDIIVQRFVDAWNVFPGLLILLTIMSIVGRGLPQIILVLGIAGGIGDARIIRSAVIGIKENVYFEAAVGGRQPKTAHICAPCHTQYYAGHNHSIQHAHRRRNPVSGCSGLPRIRSASPDS